LPFCQAARSNFLFPRLYLPLPAFITLETNGGVELVKACISASMGGWRWAHGTGSHSEQVRAL
jgi:hypothetical protein